MPLANRLVRQQRSFLPCLFLKTSEPDLRKLEGELADNKYIASLTPQLTASSDTGPTLTVSASRRPTERRDKYRLAVAIPCAGEVAVSFSSHCDHLETHRNAARRQFTARHRLHLS